ncbi:MAG: serine protease [Proteobacteria bacterium]|nr:serine protease [Pseudomonadota bacterium]
MYSYWGKGSSFLIANAHNYYWVTASHVLFNMGGCVDNLRIFPSDNSKISVPFNEQYTVNKGSTDEEEYKDVFMLRIDLNQFDNSGDSPMAAQDINQGVLHAERLKPNDELWIIGYPAERNIIDYESCEIKNTRTIIRGLYKGESISEHCHELIIDSSIKLETYDGLSGSPVFHIKQLNRNGQVVLIPMFVGMLLRGTASSRIAHFVSSNVIVNIVNIVENTA